MTSDLVARLRDETPQMLEALDELVSAESPTSDLQSTAACARVADELGTALLGSGAEHIVVDGRTHLRWRFGSEARVLLIGHLDTVWPLGTVARWPFAVDGDIATGPGCFDMKAGVVQLLFALRSLDEVDGVSILLTTDEEIGSPSSRELIEETASGLEACFVLEPSADGALKTERKGVGHYEVRVKGRSAHAGLEPENGINAGVEVAHQVLAIAGLSRPEVGTTVTPTVLTAGTSSNSVPAAASVQVDVRVPDEDEQRRVDASLRNLEPVVSGTSLEVERRAGCPPMTRAASAELFELAQRHAGELGLAPLKEASVGGGSDGNFIASIGVPTLDGIGAVGAGAHAEGEHVIVPTMAERAALVASLVGEILAARPG